MKAVIIAGGLGTRLRPLTYGTPKPIVPVANTPFVIHQIEHLAKHGVKEIILNLHYLSDEIKRILDDGKSWGVKIYYSIEEHPLGTAGAVKNAEEYFDSGPMIVFNGDILTDINITKVLAYHREKKAVVTLTLTEVEDPTPFGLILTDKEGRVTNFIEKPNWEMATARTINAGIYVVDPKIFADVPRGKPYSFERDLYPALLEKGVPVYGYLSDAFWMDIGNCLKYKEAHESILRGEVAVKIKGSRVNNKIWVGGDTHLDRQVKLLGPSILGERVQVENGTEIKDYVVVGDDVAIGSACVLDRTIIWAGSKIGNRARLSNCILGRNCVIEDDVTLGGAILADNSHICRGSRLAIS
jgi:mannose-1-phosphate guanylyltransferase/phosphomannomutase